MAFASCGYLSVYPELTIVFPRKTAGLQVYDCNELLLYFLWDTFDSYTCTGEMLEPFPTCPGVESRG